MAWASAIIGGVGIVGSLVGSKRASDSADRTANMQNRISQQNIDFQREQYDRWKGIYGNLQEDLGTYFTNMTGDKQLGMELNTIEEQRQRALQQEHTNMASRNLDGSGADIQAQQDIEFGANRASNEARNTIDDRVRAKQMNFLNGGLGKDMQIANGIGNANNAMVNSLGQQGAIRQNNINRSNNDIQGIIGYGSSILTAGLNRSNTAGQPNYAQAEQQGLF